MNTIYLSIKEIKGFARDKAKGNYFLLISVGIMQATLLMALESLCAGFAGQGSLINDLLYYLSILLIDILSCIFAFGIAHVYLGVYRGRSMNINDLFVGFKKRADKAILIGLIPVLIGYLARIPYFIELSTYTGTSMFGELVHFMPYSYGASAVRFVFGLPFAYVYYLYSDYQNATVSQIIKESFKMFKKRPGALILLYISFIPIYLLGIFSFGIAYLWINVYLNMAVTIMYDDLLPRKKQKLVAFTFDDGPNLTITPAILNCLAENDVVATFFLVGDWIRPEYRNVVKRAYDMGCEIENHSRTHSDMTKFTQEEMKAEVAFTDEAIRSITGRTPKFFRPPFISVNPEMYEAIDKTFICGVGIEDWVPTVDADTRYNRVMEAKEDGMMVLLHDMDGNVNTLEAVKRLIPALKAEGYRFVTVEEMFKLQGVTPDHSVMYSVVKQAE